MKSVENTLRSDDNALSACHSPGVVGTVAPGTVCEPVWNWWGYACEKTVISDSSCLSSIGSDASFALLCYQIFVIRRFLVLRVKELTGVLLRFAEGSLLPPDTISAWAGLTETRALRAGVFWPPPQSSYKVP
jgi:hypothetical protein